MSTKADEKTEERAPILVAFRTTGAVSRATLGGPGERDHGKRKNGPSKPSIIRFRDGRAAPGR
ncbi:MAG: hypothetical protein ACREXY_17355, partial [Gammaproteobacteria bacterium]